MYIYTVVTEVSQGSTAGIRPTSRPGVMAPLHSSKGSSGKPLFTFHLFVYPIYLKKETNERVIDTLGAESEKFLEV